MKILITGGSGYLGTNILDRFKNHTTEFIVPVRQIKNVQKDFLNTKNFHIYHYRDVSDFERVMVEHEPEFIIHCACDYGKNSHLANIIESNISFGSLITESIINNRLNTTFININSAIQTENSHYSITKKQFSDFLKDFSCKHPSIRIVDLFLNNLYGGIKDKSIVKKITCAILSNNNKFFINSGIHVRDFIEISDFLNIIEKLLSIDIKILPAYSRFKIESGEKFSIAQLVKMVENNLSMNKNIIIKQGIKNYQNLGSEIKDISELLGEINYSKIENNIKLMKI